jgi:hypothetical protein
MEYRSQTFTISDLYNWYRRNELFLQPKFQRRKIWKPVAKSYLIDTIIRGLPVPKIYYRMQVEAANIKSVREIVDGQQRLDAIFNFIDNEYPIKPSHNTDFGGMHFAELPPDTQQQVLAYEIAADLLIGASDPQVLQIFARINSYGLSLNAQEKRNAKYFGRFKELVYRLGTSHVAFWTSSDILSDSAIARMAEAELTSELLVALIDGLQDKKKSLDSFYLRFEDRFPAQRIVENKFERTLSWLDENIRESIRGTSFQRRALFYSLFVAIADLFFGIKKGVGPVAAFPKKGLDANQRLELRRQFVRLTNAVRAKRPPRDLTEFAKASAQQTDNIKPRQIRHDTLVAILRNL